jgi:predicted GNAT family acetyltransferase
MTWTLTEDIDRYAAAIRHLLRAEPERYTVMATVLASLAEHGPNVYGPDPPVLGWWTSDGAVLAAALQTPPHALQLTHLPADSIDPLVAALAPAHAAGITSVLGADADATAFAQGWQAATGRSASVQMRQRLYRLGELTPPDPMPAGAARLATPTDADVAFEMDKGFGSDTGQLRAGAALIEERLRAGRLVLWEVDGEPVSMAGITEVIGGVARIGTVYTPAPHRKRGYGSAVTAAATRFAHEQGASSVILFTDLANPTSNSIYIKLGYRPVQDTVVLAFSGEL